MPNQNDILKAKERRELRKKAREAAVEQAHAQEQNFSDLAAKSKAAPPRQQAPRKPAKEIRAEERKAAEQEADKQERDMKVDTSEVNLRVLTSRQPTLHELNKLARQQTRHFKHGARIVAKAAGKAAYSAAMSGEVPHLNPTKHQRVFNAQAALARAKAAKTNDGK